MYHKVLIKDMPKENKIFLLKELGFSSDGTYVLNEKGEKVLDRETDEPVRLETAFIMEMLKRAFSAGNQRDAPEDWKMKN